MSQTQSITQPVVLDTSQSPYAKLSPVPLNDVRLTDEFWAPRLVKNRSVTLPSQYQHLVATGRLENFRRATNGSDTEFQGLYFNDSDVYKWLEAAAWTLADDTFEQSDLATWVETITDLIVEAQEADGYLNTYFTHSRTKERWTNLRDMHELYCAGHLMQAAVAHYRVTGETRLLHVARRFGDLIHRKLGPGDSQIQGVAGHPEIEMALVELARATDDHHYLKQSQYLLDARGHGLIGGRAYHQDHQPFRDLDRLTGHAVRAVYLAAGAADLYMETGDPELLVALERLWAHMRTRQMYITGGLGGRHQGETIGTDYELPNARAYAETCAGIANVMWAWRMLQIAGEPKYADVMERALYNAVLPGLSLDAETYFYVNPLSTDGIPEPGSEGYRRQPWFDCACCPPNIARTVAAFPGLLYGVEHDTIWVHHYAAGEAALALPDGPTVKLIQRTRYPWSGQVVIDTLTPGTYTIKVRIPGWCREAPDRDRPTVTVNGGSCPGEVRPGEYVEVSRTWAAGDALCIQLPMPIRRIISHPHILENTGRVALMRGPLLYCLEAVDHLTVPDLRDVVLPDSADLTSTFDPRLLGGVQVIEGEALATTLAADWEEDAYSEIRPMIRQTERLKIRAVPYFAWANRAPGAMQVWLKRA